MNDEKSLLPLGKISVTPQALSCVGEERATALLLRHAQHDWGDVTSAQAELNLHALICDGYIRSQHQIRDGIVLVIVTIPSRLRTRIVLLEEE